MGYKLDSQFIGYPPIDQVVAAALGGLVPAGFIARCDDPVWGGGEVVWARANGTIPAYQLCVLTPVISAGPPYTYRQDMTAVPNTANLGRALYVNQGGAMVAGQWGWFMRTGVTPVDCNASVAADTTFGIAAAGQGGANTAGKQILGGRVVAPATTTVVKVGTGESGGFVINVANTDGWFIGGFLSGTGVGAASRVVSIDPLGKFVTVSVANSAAVSGNVTLTYNNAVIFYNVAALNVPFAQGAIT